jgi:exopolysaccharide production protein ExoY
MTGLWQISGRSDLTHEERLALDLEYISKQSFMFDLSILVRTVPIVLRAEGR